MSNKRMHPNGWYAKKQEDGIYRLYFKSNPMMSNPYGEELLQDFGFSPAPDVFEACAQAIDDECLGMLHLKGVEEILKKYFQHYVDAYEKDI